MATLGLAAFAFAELFLCWPVAWWLYAALFPCFTLGLLRPVAWRAQLGALALLGLACLSMILLYVAPWSTRKSFVRSLHSIPLGAPERDARYAMRRYRVLTHVHGPPAPPLAAPPPRQAAAPHPTPPLCDVSPGDGGTFASDEIPIGHARLIYRHSCDGAFNADFGVVDIANGKVTDVQFQPD
jgi:hypothetical protein